MATKYTRPTFVMNFKREFFADIVAQRKNVEYRTMSLHWLRRLEKVGPTPLNLRLMNGMTPTVPEATVRVLKVVKRKGELQFHLGRVLEVKNWNRKHEKPT